MDEKDTRSQLNLFTFLEVDKPQESLSQSEANELKEINEGGNDDWYDFDLNAEDTTQNSSEETVEETPDETSQKEDASSSPTHKSTLENGISTSNIGLPIFEYAGANETIRDLKISFESLRIVKSSDFPELENPDKVSWTMDYGIVRQIGDTKKTIGQVKAEIEASKEFLDAVKKAKKPITCKVKPKVIGQTKGSVSSYKGVFTSLESAVKANKLISIIPSSDGHVYEMRNTEIGLFITRTKDVQELDKIAPCFKMRLPKIPSNILQQVITFFRSYLKTTNKFEALVHLLWDRQEETYTVYVPQQVVSKDSVKSQDTNFDDNRYLLVADIHSHNTMSAKFSSVDDEDEKATRLYIVIGKLHRYFPEINVRISNGGKYHKIDPCDVFELNKSTYPILWHSRVIENSKELIDQYVRSGAA